MKVGPMESAVVGAFIMAFCSAVFMYFYNESSPVIQATVERHVLTSTVKAGEFFAFKTEWKLDKVCSYTVIREIVDQQGQMIHRSFDTRREETQVEIINKRIWSAYITEFAAKGTAYYNSYTSWDCNVVQHFWPQWKVNEPLQFTIE